MIESQDYCKAKGENTDIYCSKYLEYGCEGCPLFDEEEYEMADYENECK